jgi:long-chain acyl-CoA synthetase
VALGEQYDNLENKGIVYNIKLVIARKLVFSKWRDALGGTYNTLLQVVQLVKKS